MSMSTDADTWIAGGPDLPSDAMDRLYLVLREWFASNEMPTHEGSFVAHQLALVARVVRAAQAARTRGPRAPGVWEELFDALDALEQEAS